MLEEVNSRSSRILFVMTQPNNPVRSALENASEAGKKNENSGEFYTPPAPGYGPSSSATSGSQAGAGGMSPQQQQGDDVAASVDSLSAIAELSRLWRSSSARASFLP